MTEAIVGKPFQDIEKFQSSNHEPSLINLQYSGQGQVVDVENLIYVAWIVQTFHTKIKQGGDVAVTSLVNLRYIAYPHACGVRWW